MKLLHCSDIHLGKRPIGSIGAYSEKRYLDYFRAFDWIAQTAIERKIDLLLIAGDFFDKREISPDVLGRAEEVLRRLLNHGIFVAIIEGNHDPVGGREDSWILYLESKGLVKRPYAVQKDDGGWDFIPVRFSDIEIYGLGYPGGFVNELLGEFNRFLDEKKPEKAILMVHTAIGTGEYLPGTAEAANIGALQGKVLYAAGGHFHSFSAFPAGAPFFFVPGSPEYWDLGETGKKGVVIYDTNTRQYEFVESSRRKRSEYAFIADETVTAENFRERFEAQFAGLDIDAGEEIVVVNITARNGLYVDTAWCEAFLEGLGALKAVAGAKYTGQAVSSAVFSGMSVEAVEKELVASWKHFGPFAEQIAPVIGKLKEMQADGRADDFRERMDQVLELVLSGAEDSDADQ